MCAMIHDPQTPAQAFRLRRCAVRHALGVGTTSPLNFSLTAFSPYCELSKVPVTRFPSTSSVITVSVLSPLFLNVVGLAETHRPVASRIAKTKASFTF